MKHFALAIMAFGVFCAQSRAAVVVNVSELAGDVVFSASGVLNIDALAFSSDDVFTASVWPDLGGVVWIPTSRWVLFLTRQ